MRGHPVRFGDPVVAENVASAHPPVDGPRRRVGRRSDLVVLDKKVVAGAERTGAAPGIVAELTREIAVKNIKSVRLLAQKELVVVGHSARKTVETDGVAAGRFKSIVVDSQLRCLAGRADNSCCFCGPGSSSERESRNARKAAVF